MGKRKLTKEERMKKRKEKRRRSEEQKERQRRKEEERHNAWLSQFQSVGVTSENELYDLLYDNDECEELPEETVENGFPDYAVWDTLYDQNPSEETLHISRYSDKYIFWNSGCFVGTEAYDPFEEDFAMLFDSLDEARDYRDKRLKGEKPIMEQIFDCKAELGDDSYYLKADSAGRNYNIFYNRNLIIENLYSLKDIDYLKAARDRYIDFKKSLAERGVTLISVEKRPREWNQNQRFYDYEIRYKNQPFTLSGYVLSRTQHQTRETLDRFPEEDLERFIREVDTGDPYPGKTKKEKEQAKREWEEYQAQCEAAYQGIPHGEGITPVSLDQEQKRLLSDYLDSRCVLSRCDGTLKHTVNWVIDHIPEKDRAGVLEEIRLGGGYCDCEVIMNYMRTSNKE